MNSKRLAPWTLLALACLASPAAPADFYTVTTTVQNPMGLSTTGQYVVANSNGTAPALTLTTPSMPMTILGASSMDLAVGETVSNQTQNNVANAFTFNVTVTEFNTMGMMTGSGTITVSDSVTGQINPSDSNGVTPGISLGYGAFTIGNNNLTLGTETFSIASTTPGSISSTSPTGTFSFPITLNFTSPLAVPEPASAAMMALGMAGVGAITWARRRGRRA